MEQFAYKRILVEDEAHIDQAFCAEFGSPVDGSLDEETFDRVYDHLIDVLTKFGTFLPGFSGGDFSSSRYVDPRPWSRVVAEAHVPPSLSVQAGLLAVNTSEIPFAVAFDSYPDLILVLPPNRVFATFGLDALQDG